MHHPIAIDPNILTTWQAYSYIVQDCGVHHGRLIADYPNRWRKMVLEAAVKAHKERASAAGNKPTNLDYTRIEYHLQHEVAAKLIVRNGAYDFQNLDWLAQAEKEHARQPFRAIISDANPREVHGVLKIAALDKDNCPRWNVRPDKPIVREPQVLADTAKPLFSISKKVKFIDPNFAPETTRYRSALTAFLATIRSANFGIAEVEYHLRAKAEGGFFDNQIRRFTSTTPSVIPRGMRVSFVRWEQLPGGDDMHPRYVLTDRGGLAYDVGLDAGKPGEMTKVYRISAASRDETWNQYERIPKDALGNPVTTHFKLVDQFSIVGT